MGEGWCPYNLFRTSGDIINVWDRVIENLMSVTKFLTPKPGAPVRGPRTPIRDISCCCRPLTGVPYLRPGPRRARLRSTGRSSHRSFSRRAGRRTLTPPAHSAGLAAGHTRKVFPQFPELHESFVRRLVSADSWGTVGL